MTDAITGISEAGYLATADQIKELGALSVGATRLKDTIGTTYLRALARRAQHAGGPVSPEQAVNEAHADLYPHVLAGVYTPDVWALLPLKDHKAENKRRALERNSRSNFARTAASTLRKFVNAGGDLMGLDVSNLTKSSLIASTAHLIPTNLSTPDIGLVTTPTHATRGNLARAWSKFVNALAKDGDRYNMAGYFVGQLESIRDSFLSEVP